MDYAKTAFGYVMGPGFIPQLLLTIVVFLLLVAVLNVIETIVNTFTTIDRQTAVLMPDTLTGNMVIPQSASADSPIYNSVNEVNGMEFSYSMYLFVSPETFESQGGVDCGTTVANTDATALKHIFHRGSRDGFPLLAPGLFCHGNKNTLRLYMNSTTKWDNYVEIPNIPVGKWFHIVIMMKGKFLDVFVNGNVTVRHEFPTVPKLNYGNAYILSQIKFPKPNSNVKVDGFKIDGPAKGMVSRLNYFSYALNYSQIDELYRQGPSAKIVTKSISGLTPPYFHDDWWVTKY